MSLIVHLSDLHFGAEDRLTPTIQAGLVRALQTIADPSLLILTGDAFDSSEPHPETLDGFVDLLGRVDEALGGRVPMLLLPGNHDRRGAGVFAPWSGVLFDTLARRLEDAGLQQVRVTGRRTPFLAEFIDVPGLAADVVAYDSTYLPEGLVSAGGHIRQPDLLEIGGRLSDGDSERPLLFLLHHHLVPTPVTDTSIIDTRGRPFLERLAVNRILPALVANGDREEITMTALGAGSALATLQHLGRAVVVLHGHKHIPSARLLKGIGPEEADVLLASAGSCGTATAWSGSDLEEAPRLWPSFNVLDLSSTAIEAHTASWSPWDQNRINEPRALVHARRLGLRWELEALDAPPSFAPVLASNEAEYTLSESRQFLERYDVSVRRTVRALPEAYMKVHYDIVEAAPGARLTEVCCDGQPEPHPHERRLQVPMNGEASWRVVGAHVATLREGQAAYGAGTAYEWVGLVNRSRCKRVRVTVNLGPVDTEPFAALTDLTTGKERPLTMHRSGRSVTIEREDCPARTLLRVYWPLRNA